MSTTQKDSFYFSFLFPSTLETNVVLFISRLALNVRSGYSHKLFFSNSTSSSSIYLVEEPSTLIGYPYVDLQECYGFERGMPHLLHSKRVEFSKFGMVSNWQVDRSLVIPRKLTLIHGHLFYIPNSPLLYVDQYLRSFYNCTSGENWYETCRGHWGTYGQVGRCFIFKRRLDLDFLIDRGDFFS